MLTAYSTAPEADDGEAVLDVLQTEFDRDPVETMQGDRNRFDALHQEENR